MHYTRTQHHSGRSAIWGQPVAYARTLFEALTQSDAPGSLNKGDIPVRVLVHAHARASLSFSVYGT